MSGKTETLGCLVPNAPGGYNQLGVVSKSLGGYNQSGAFSSASEAPVGHTATGEPVHDWELVFWRNTGKAISEDTWIDAQAMRQKIRRQSIEVADRLQALTGRSSYLPGVTKISLDESVAPADWERSEETPFRNALIIPEIARAKRSSLCVKLRAFLAEMSRDLELVGRYIVLTGGPRCASTEIDARRARLRRCVTELRKELPAFGLSVEFIAEECTCDETKPWEERFHPHVNMLVLAKRGQHLDYKGINAKISEVLGGSHWRDCGELKDVREFLKYVTKGDEILAMSDETFREYVHYYEGAHLVQSYGFFAAFRRDLADNHETYKDVYRDGDFHLTRVKVCRRFQVEGARPSSGAVVVAVTSPVPAFGPVLRPMVIIVGTGLSQATIEGAIKASPQAMRVLEILNERVPPESRADGSHLYQNSTRRSGSEAAKGRNYTLTKQQTVPLEQSLDAFRERKVK